MPDSRGSTPQVLSEAAQECLADLAVFPGFLQEVYASLDCRVECSNLFEDMCQVWSLFVSECSNESHACMITIVCTSCCITVYTSSLLHHSFRICL